MTPKEKAEDLWLVYYELIDDDYSNEAAKKMAKKYALIAVDEIIKYLTDILVPNPFAQYWQQVKQEIENL